LMMRPASRNEAGVGPGANAGSQPSPPWVPAATRRLCLGASMIGRSR
jgi:hypothetical protein